MIITSETIPLDPSSPSPMVAMVVDKRWIKKMIRVQKEDFDIGREIAALSGGNDESGAIVSFTGRVRGLAGHGKKRSRLLSMTLEHYPGMTESELERIEKQANERWKLLDSLIIHRHGRLLPGDNIVLVVTISTHRRDAFEAAMFMMDFLKTDALFWKREEFEEGESWVEAKSADDHARQGWDKD